MHSYLLKVVLSCSYNFRRGISESWRAFWEPELDQQSQRFYGQSHIKQQQQTWRAASWTWWVWSKLKTTIRFCKGKSCQSWDGHGQAFFHFTNQPLLQYMLTNTCWVPVPTTSLAGPLWHLLFETVPAPVNIHLSQLILSLQASYIYIV